MYREMTIYTISIYFEAIFLNCIFTSPENTNSSHDAFGIPSTLELATKLGRYRVNNTTLSTFAVLIKSRNEC